MASAARTQAACLADAMRISVAPVSDGTREQLCQRLREAIDTANWLKLHDSAMQATRYLRAIEGGDPVSYAMLRHFAAELCEWIEGKVYA